MSHLISASILNADFSQLGKEIEMVNNSETDWFHLDIMDGVFVPNISFGFPIIEQVKKYAQKPLDVHLMIADPDKYIERFKDAGTDMLTVHYETCSHLNRTIEHIKSLGMKAGVALNPHTPVHLLENVLEDLNLVLIMTVNPGFGGQKFIPQSYNKIKQLKQMVDNKNLSTHIQVDGGIDLSNIRKLAETGVDVFVIGSYIFKADNPVDTIAKLKKG